ncbi:MAG: tRNA-dihydrouridine synthase [Parcubacteria group bacterium Gr01-1014_18]|nr:MAG: tRNA-dihydrouridine synthase [Parcubacteria group bacterium Greene0416_36]TSC80981.1 MAG: tRNA-dihydrouridine synthase [Parcubacteria group bacterium Gr01-1014_18]TSC98868.1 MAG: tRNA-dihydrouridine synthase [Parcubacteria group bacterium Greene1014_20]TSD06546.1 MAG: tRNA-dihydrouridine synthase [Parcubacteria group bacterium Greene0714_2]
MPSGFWSQLKAPFFVLAPMIGVTDSAFRQMFCCAGKPDVLWTEFTSADGLCSAGKEALMDNLYFEPRERPIVAQIFGKTPENFFKVAEMLAQMGFDGIDINMGCPDKNVLKQKSGAYLINTPRIAQEIIKATREGAPNLPVSVKTRLGYNKIETDEWIPYLLEMNISALTIHGRTRKEMSKVPADWDEIAKVVQIVKQSGKKTLVIGNGDVASMADAREKVREFGVDGVMIGRGVFGNPLFFNESPEVQNPTVEQKLQLLLDHTLLFDKLFSGKKSFALMKKHFASYISGFPYTKDIKIALMEAKDAGEVKGVIKAHLGEK